MHALRYFALVADSRSYQTAAQQARRTQPALSLAIRQFEETLGQPLFEPDDRSRLTPFGEACLPPIKDLIEHYARTTEVLGRIARHEHDTVTFACVPTASTHLVPSVLPLFSRTFPQVGVSLLDDNSRNIESMVANGHVDFGLCSVSDPAQLDFEPLIQDRYGIICARHHPIAGKKQLDWDELLQLPLIESIAFQQLRKAPELAALPQPKIQVWNMMSLLAMVERGNGVTILATLTIPPSYSERISFVPIVGPILPREVGILRQSGRSLSLPGREMIGLIRQHVQDRMPEFRARRDTV